LLDETANDIFKDIPPDISPQEELLQLKGFTG